MSKNRVEELEATVAELQSTVQGLTEELVEAKERIRVLEAELDTESPTRVPERRAEDRPEEEEVDADPDEVEEAAATVDEQDDAEPEDSGVDDIIVA